MKDEMIQEKRFDTIVGCVSWVVMAFVLFCLFMSNRALRELNKVQMDGYKEIIKHLNDSAFDNDCYCRTEEESDNIN